MGNPLRALTLDDLRRRTSMKWQRHPADVLPAWVAEMDVPLAGPIVRAVGEAMALGDTGYPDERPIYAEALAWFAERRWGWRLPVERTRLVPDVMLGVVEVLELVTGPGAAVVVNSPVYTPFYQFIEHMDRRVVEAPLGPDHRLDLDALAAAFRAAADLSRPAGRGRSPGSGGTAAYLLCSPHNPTGTVHTRDELLAAIELAARHGVRIVVDEIHAPLVYPDAVHVPFLTLPGAENAFSLMSASKAWNLAGLKAAVAVAGEAAAAELERMPEEVGHGASHVGVIAHVAALREGGPWLDETLRGLDENRHLLGKLLAEHLPDVAYRPPEGTYLAWLDCRALGLGDDPAAAFLDRGRVAVNSGPSFGTGGAGHVRLNIANPPDLLAGAVRRMAAATAPSGAG